MTARNGATATGQAPRLMPAPDAYDFLERHPSYRTKSRFWGRMYMSD